MLNDPAFSHVATLSILVLASKNYVKNPYLKSKIVEVCSYLLMTLSFHFLFLYFPPPIFIFLILTIKQLIFIMTPGILNRRHDLLDTFTAHPLAPDHLAPALISMYIGML